MPYATVTLSSVGTSIPTNLDWRGGKPATVVITTTGSSATFTVEYTLDDLQIVGGTSRATWFGVSSYPFPYGVDGANAVTFGASLGYVYIPFPTPVAAVRINCSSNSASAPLTLKLMQGDGG